MIRLCVRLYAGVCACATSYTLPTTHMQVVCGAGGSSGLPSRPHFYSLSGVSGKSSCIRIHALPGRQPLGSHQGRAWAARAVPPPIRVRTGRPAWVAKQIDFLRNLPPSLVPHAGDWLKRSSSAELNRTRLLASAEHGSVMLHIRAAKAGPKPLGRAAALAAARQQQLQQGAPSEGGSPDPKSQRELVQDIEVRDS